MTGSGKNTNPDKATIDQPKGGLSGESQSHSLSANDQLFGAKQFQELVVTYRDGATVRLKDVARVVDEAAGHHERPAPAVLDPLAGRDHLERGWAAGLGPRAERRRDHRAVERVHPAVVEQELEADRADHQHDREGGGRAQESPQFDVLHGRIVCPPLQGPGRPASSRGSNTP